jgi:hypothetical protein
VAVINSDPAVTTISLFARIVRAYDGFVSLNRFDLPVTSVRAVNSNQFDLPEGYMLSLQAVGNVGTNRGRCFVQCSIVRGAGASKVGFTQLISDYFSRAHDPAWPVGEYISSVENSGAVRSVLGTTPGAGAEISETVPSGARWRLKAIRFRLTASAAAANRTVSLSLDDGTNNFFLESFNVVQAASSTEDYSAGIGVPFVNDAANTRVSSGLPDNLLFAGFRIRTSTVGLQAADQYSLLDYLVEEWIEA